MTNAPPENYARGTGVRKEPQGGLYGAINKDGYLNDIGYIRSRTGKIRSDTADW
jgi:hypothetical protein